MYNIINLTPHTVKYLDSTGAVHVFAPSGSVARVPVKRCVSSLNRPDSPFRFLDVSNGRSYNIPDSKDNTLYIVSSVVAVSSLRGDLICPSDFVRDKSGNIVSCTSFTRFIGKGAKM